MQRSHIWEDPAYLEGEQSAHGRPQAAEVLCLPPHRCPVSQVSQTVPLWSSSSAPPLPRSLYSLPRVLCHCPLPQLSSARVRHCFWSKKENTGRMKAVDNMRSQRPCAPAMGPVGLSVLVRQAWHEPEGSVEPLGRQGPALQVNLSVQ